MRFRAILFAFVAAATVAAGRQAAAIVEPVQGNLLPDDLATHLFRAERVAVFRLDPNDRVVGAADGPGKKPAATWVAEPAVKADAAAKVGVRRLEDASRFQGYRVVRSAVVDTPDKVVHLVRTMERAMAEDVRPAKCFIPEYGVRFTVGDKSEELLLSLKCLQFSVKLPDDAEAMYVIADGPGNGGCQATLDRLLDGAEVAPSGAERKFTIGPAEVTPVLCDAPWVEGLAVDRRGHDSPLARAGVPVHAVIVRYGDRDVTTSQQLVEAIAAYRDAPIDVEVLLPLERGQGARERKTFRVTAVPKPSPETGEAPPAVGIEARPPVPDGRPGTDGLEAVAEAVNHLGIGLYRGLGKSGTPQDNVVISPLSLATAISMLAAGSGGETAREFAGMLLDDPVGTVYHARFGLLLDRLAPRADAAREKGATPDSPQLRIATRLYLGDGIGILEDFARTAREQYRSAAAPLDVGNPEAASRAVNAWVDEATAGNIKGIVDAETIQQCRMLLVNAVHLKAAWVIPFGGNTANAPFHVGPRETVPVSMMRRQARFGYAHVNEPDFALQVLEMPYAASGLRMVILLPEGETSLDDVERRLSPKAWQDWLKTLSVMKVNVSLPRFKIETPASDMIPSLRDLGVSAAFGDAADFSRLASERLKVDGVRHAATITVDESGTEAAAATSGGTAVVSAFIDAADPVEFRADRPFLFVVHDSATRTMLFMGRLGRPDAARAGVPGRAALAVPGSGPGR